MSFQVAVVSNGMTLVMGNHVAQINCNYQNDYVSVIDFNDVDLEFDGSQNLDGDTLSFELTRYTDSSYSNAVNGTIIAGNTIY